MDEARNQDAFERLLFATIAHETTPVEGRCTYSAEIFISSLAGELSPLEEDQLSAHLLICPTCAKEYTLIEKALQQDKERIYAQSRVPLLAEHTRQKQEVQRRWHVLTSLLQFKEHRLRGVVGVAVATLAIALSIIIPLHYLMRESPRIIPTDGQMVAKGEHAIESTSALITKLTPKSLVDKLDSMAGYEPWRAAAFVIGYLRSTGVPLGSASLAFDRQIGRAHV